jgi:hypothetical protein
MTRKWNVITVTERRDGYRADVTVDHTSGACYEQVHVLNDGPESGRRLLHSVRFDIANLGDAANNVNAITDYTQAMLGTIIRRHSRDTGNLNPTEHAIVSKLVHEILARGYVVSVHDGEEFAIKRSADYAAIMAAIGVSDETRLILREHVGIEVGWIQLIHGNDNDVISDYTINLASIVAAAEPR